MSLKIISLTVLASVILVSTKCQSNTCQLCMQTYKTNCSICFERCNAPNNFINCTSYACTNKDADGNCIGWNPTAQATNSCLGTCCVGFAPNQVYSQTNFNLCIERDASIQQGVNIGLTLGLVLSLLAILFVAGLACLLIMICCDQDQVKNSNAPVSAEGINTIRYNTDRKDVDNTWFIQANPYNGVCSICNRGRSGFVAACGHDFHYGCLSRNMNISGQQRCPVCSQTNSLLTGKMYCSVCNRNYRQFHGDRQTIDAKSIQAIQNIKCNACQ